MCISWFLLISFRDKNKIYIKFKQIIIKVIAYYFSTYVINYPAIMGNYFESISFLENKNSYTNKIKPQLMNFIINRAEKSVLNEAFWMIWPN